MEVKNHAGFNDPDLYTISLCVFFYTKMLKTPDEIKHTCFIKINKMLILTKNRYISYNYSRSFAF